MGCSPIEHEGSADDASSPFVAARRLANDSIFEAAQRFTAAGDDHSYTFVCECGAPECRQLVTLGLADYTRLPPGAVTAHAV